MKNNRDILNEAFFKKSFSAKLMKDMPDYKALDKQSNNSGFGTVLDKGFAVTDADAVKRRLTGAFGAAFGNNSIKTMASRALKTFPIIVSDNVEPDTVITLKRLMEEQYAEYVNLLVSNQVIDLSAYSTDENGNIAIQALDDISGTDFSKRRLANKAFNGTATADDIFANIPLYNLIRQESCAVPSMGDSVMDTLFEDAVVVPENYVDSLIEYMVSNANEIAELLTESGDPSPKDPKEPQAKDPKEHNFKDHRSIKTYDHKRYTTLSDFINDNTFDDNNAAKYNSRAVNRDRVIDTMRGFQGIDDDGKEIYTKLSNTEMLLDKNMLQSAMNRSVGEMLADPKNSIIREKFEKATYLLQSFHISGKEYISYVTARLGIPMSTEVRKELLLKFPISGLNRAANPYKISNADVRRIAQNKKILSKTMPRMLKTKVSDVLLSLGVGIGSSVVGVGTGIASGFLPGFAGSIAPIAINPFLAWALIPAAVGAGATLLIRMAKKASDKKALSTKIEGWERVEALIEKMDENQQDVINKYSTPTHSELKKAKELEDDHLYGFAPNAYGNNSKDTRTFKPQFATANVSVSDNEDKSEVVDLKKQLEDMRNTLAKYGIHEEATPRIEYRDTFKEMISEEYLEVYTNIFEEVAYELINDKEAYAEYLEEAIKTQVPTQIKYVEKKPGKDIMIAPAYTARSALAYGSTEIDRRVAKERRYNQPLIMTIKFRERFDSGEYSDNELVAVIGILGQVIRVPSEEMAYILTKNAEGETLQGFLSGDKTTANTISDLISSSKISKDIKNLPQSSEIWKNLEKVAHLAVSNKLAGRKTNNIANAHIIFSQKEIDEVRSDIGVDYLRDKTLTANLMKRYSAFTMMIANDPGQRVYVFDDLENISWNVVPYSALLSKDSGDQLTAALAKLGQGRI